jgi:hypothetical protein
VGFQPDLAQIWLNQWWVASFGFPCENGDRWADHSWTGTTPFELSVSVFSDLALGVLCFSGGY